MARGKKTDEAAVYQIMAAWAENPDNINEVCKKTGASWNTCKKVIEENRDKPEFVKLCEQKKEAFMKKAERVLDLSVTLAEMKLMNAIQAEKAGKDSGIPINHLSTVFGTMYDKLALARGEATENTKITVILPEEVKKYAK